MTYPVLFIIKMEETIKECRTGDPWQILYADDLVITAESKHEGVVMFLRWQEAMACCGLKINVLRFACLN